MLPAFPSRPITLLDSNLAGHPPLPRSPFTWRLPPQEARDRNSPPSKAFLRTPKRSFETSESREFTAIISRASSIFRVIDRFTGTSLIEGSRLESALSEKFIAARQKYAPRCKYRIHAEEKRGKHPGGKSATGSGSSGQSGPETKIPFVDSSPSEPKD